MITIPLIVVVFDGRLNAHFSQGINFVEFVPSLIGRGLSASKLRRRCRRLTVRGGCLAVSGFNHFFFLLLRCDGFGML